VRQPNKKTVAAAALAVLLPLLGSGASAQTTLTLGGSDAIGTTIDRGNAMFSKLVNERAAGKLKVNFIQGEQLGNDVQVIEQMMKGSVHLYGDVLDWYANWVKDFSIFAWGFTFRDNDHYQKFLDSDTFTRMAEDLRTRQGVRILASAPTQPRVLFAKKPVNTPDDLKDVKMRVPEIKTYLNLWTTLGTRPSRVAWAEVFLGLKTGVIDATEGPISSAYGAKIHNAAPNMMRTDHLVSSQHITINEKAYQSLSPDLQKILNEAAREAVTWSRQESEKETEELTTKIGAEGAKVIRPDRGPFAEKAIAAVQQMEQDGAWAPGLWQKIRDIK
jgi:TRAP-type C4-dicarboxylate transport system substrate-binding protein